MRVCLAAKHAEYYARVAIDEGAERKEKLRRYYSLFDAFAGLVSMLKY